MSGRRRRWIVALVAIGPVAWVAQLLALYALVPVACRRDAVVALWAVATATLAVALLPVAAGGFRPPRPRSAGGERRWRRRLLSDDLNAGPTIVGDATEVMWGLAVSLGAFFAFAAALGGLAVALVGPCR